MKLKSRMVFGIIAACALLIVFFICEMTILDMVGNKGVVPVVLDESSQHYKAELSDSHDDGLTELDRVHRARREHILRTCLQRPSQYRVKYDLSSYFSFSDRHHLVFCAIQKVGCSFWLQVMKILTNQLPSGSLYQDSFYHLTGMKGSNYSFSAKNASEREHMLRSYTKFMFARDPYARIFSAYMDKVFNPTEQMKYILKKLQMNRSNDSAVRDGHVAECVTNISFLNFLETIMSVRSLLDPHFTPMFRHCDPCSIRFDYIGKMENFTSDTQYILQKAGVNLSLLTSNKKLFHEGNEILAIRDFAKSILFFRRSVAKRCSPEYLCDIYARIWVTLQARGLISTKVPFPFPSENCDSSAVPDPIRRLIEAHLHSGNRSERMRQRHMAMREAYHSLPRSTLQKLEDFVKDDCDLFGYECSVDARFPQGGHAASNYSFFHLFW